MLIFITLVVAVTLLCFYGIFKGGNVEWNLRQLSFKYMAPNSKKTATTKKKTVKKDAVSTSNKKK